MLFKTVIIFFFFLSLPFRELDATKKRLAQTEDMLSEAQRATSNANDARNKEQRAARLLKQVKFFSQFFFFFSYDHHHNYYFNLSSRRSLN